MRIRHIGCMATLVALAAVAALSPSTAGAADRCKLLMFPPVPVSMDNLRPVIPASINGTEARFIVDTGAFFDFLSPAAAAEFKLSLADAPPWYYVSGVGGSFLPKVATAKTFAVAGLSVSDKEFLVGNNDFPGGIVGILGQDLFRIADLELDFSDGVLRFAKPQHCSDRMLAYWAANQAVGIVQLRWTSEQQPHLLGKASVNGHDIEVLFDTGSWRTVLSLDAAKRAGITPESPGVVPAGESTGLGGKPVPIWAAPIDKFEIGGEAIEHTHVLIGDIGMRQLGADMLLGSDFFLAHHVYIANSQSKLYFTYNGGPVFALSARPPTQAKAPATGAPNASAQPGTAASPGTRPGTAANPGAAASPSAPASPGSPTSPSASANAGPATNPGASAAPMPVSNAPTDAAGFLRRGMAYASRGELEPALSDLTRAMQLDPRDPQSHYQRGLVYWRDRQPRLALQDFDAALVLDPNDYQAYLARAELQLPRIHAAVEDDLSAVDRLAPQQADLRMVLGDLYHAIGQYAAAVHQYDLWIDYHEDDVRFQRALATRCGLQAAANIDLDRALDDCKQALSRLPPAERAVALSNRSLVYLRLGQLDRSIADATGAIGLQARSGNPLYVRGLAELRQGLTTKGQADIAAAKKLQPDIARHYEAMGLKP